MIELTVIGGYLGAGKTTLLNELLSREDGERVAVIVNDFGAVNIDAQIIGDRDGRTVEIANGCICCDLSDGMAAAIETIRAADPPVSRVFVEVSGVGQPDVVARWGSHPGFSHGGALVCADVTSIRRDVSRKWVGETVRSQLQAADRLLLTKADLATPEQIAEVSHWLTQLPGVDAELVDRADLVGPTTGSGAGTASGAGTVGGAASADDSDAAGSAAAAGGPVDSGQSRGAGRPAEQTHTSWSITVDSPVDIAALRQRLEALPPDIVRAKGILSSTDDPARSALVHFDGTRADSEDLGDRSSEPRDGGSGHFVVIAAGVHSRVLPAVRDLASFLDGDIDDSHHPT